jgi:hypothetical protein
LFWLRQSKRALLIIALYLAAQHGVAASADRAGAEQRGVTGHEGAGGQSEPKGASLLPEFVIDKTLHDFGEVFAGEEVYSVFTVTNAGNAPLELSDKPLLATRPSVSLYHRTASGSSLLLLKASAFRPAPV